MEWNGGMEYWNNGMPYFIPHLNKTYAYPDAAQAVSVSSQSHEWAIKAIQSERLSSGMREVVGKAARIEHIVGKTLGVTAYSFAPVQSRRRHYSQAEKSSLCAQWVGWRMRT